VKQGAYEQAIATFGLAATALYSLGTYYEYALNQNSIGYGYLSGGWYDQAQAVFIFAIQTFDKIGSLSGKALALSNLGELYVTTQQWPQAETTLREAQELALACAKPLLGAAVDVDRGRMLAAHGNTEAARQVWQSALTVQEAKGALQAAQHTRQLLASLFYT
jgi:tetratricopeptide (TPR) repeat protein